MEYQEKTELKEEITKTSKRSIKTCIALGFAVLIVEGLIWCLIGMGSRIQSDLSDILFWCWLVFCVRALQFLLIGWFIDE